MCTPKMPKVEQQKQEIIATPTVADASVAKSRRNAQKKTASMSGKDIKTSARGLGEEAVTTKKKLLGE